MGTVYADVMHVLCPIIGVTIREAAGIEAAERVVSEEQRPAVRHADRQPDAVPRPAVAKSAAAREALVVDRRLDGVTRRARREHVGHETLVPTTDRVIHGPAVVRTPVP